MLLNIGWGEIALRLALTVAAGILIGTNRSEHGHAAGVADDFTGLFSRVAQHASG
jgi:hypothetical protein